MNNRNISRIYLLLLKLVFLCLLCTPNTAQEMKIISAKTVSIDGHRIPYQNLHEQFEPIPTGTEAYLNSLKSDKRARDTGYTTLGLIGGGALLLLAGNATQNSSCAGFCLNAGQAIGFLSITVGGSIVGTAALITRAKSVKKIEHAVSLYNQYHVEEVGAQSAPSLHLGLTSHGIGLVYNF